VEKVITIFILPPPFLGISRILWQMARPRRSGRVSTRRRPKAKPKKKKRVKRTRRSVRVPRVLPPRAVAPPMGAQMPPVPEDEVGWWAQGAVGERPGDVIVGPGYLERVGARFDIEDGLSDDDDYFRRQYELREERERVVEEPVDFAPGWDYYHEGMPRRPKKSRHGPTTTTTRFNPPRPRGESTYHSADQPNAKRAHFWEEWDDDDESL